MIRSLRIRDGSRFLAAAHAGLYLDERAARVDRFHPIEAATISMFFPDLAPVLTLSDPSGSYFLQLSHRRRGDEGRLLFMAPAPMTLDPEATGGWEIVLPAVVEWAAAHGIRRLVAEVALDERRPALLQRLGFERTRRYTVWAGSAGVVEQAFRALAGRRPLAGASPWALYRGARGAWVEEIRSISEDPLPGLAQTLADLGARWRHPVYVQVRRETPGVAEALRALGFHPAFTLWRMVRWIAVPLRWPSAEELETRVSASLAFYFRHMSPSPMRQPAASSG
ncbi:hypothetical protein HRbin22_00662 [Candidatus Thermoflexus japonica]|uniref:Uncharacterized protein n=1 Tax=Candidatus Thermoflexus japonica TaxID=2035417 RepID=A0A2H5Y4U6_9CHLR|nr:hypothetical protein HRbin22_00662 [Candidatus Thermoflexus japonica]